MARRKRWRVNPGNVFLGDDDFPYTPKPERAPVYGKSGIDAGKDEEGPMSLEDWIALAAPVAVGVMIAKTMSPPSPPDTKAGEAALKNLETSGPALAPMTQDPLPLAPSYNQLYDQLSAELAAAASARAAAAYPLQFLRVIQAQAPNYGTHQQSPEQKKQVQFEISKLDSPSGPSDITGTKTASLVASNDGPTRKIDRLDLKHGKFSGYGDASHDIVATGAEVADALSKASSESTAYLEQAAVHPDQIVENTKKMSPLGLALTLYSLHWAYKMLG